MHSQPAPKRDYSDVLRLNPSITPANPYLSHYAQPHHELPVQVQQLPPHSPHTIQQAQHMHHEAPPQSLSIFSGSVHRPRPVPKAEIRVHSPGGMQLFVFRYCIFFLCCHCAMFLCSGPPRLSQQVGGASPEPVQLREHPHRPAALAARRPAALPPQRGGRPVLPVQRQPPPTQEGSHCSATLFTSLLLDLMPYFLDRRRLRCTTTARCRTTTTASGTTPRSASTRG